MPNSSSINKYDPNTVFTIAGAVFGLSMFATFLISYVMSGEKISFFIVMLSATVFLAVCGPLFGKLLHWGWLKRRNG